MATFDFWMAQHATPTTHFWYHGNYPEVNSTPRQKSESLTPKARDQENLQALRRQEVRKRSRE